MDSKVKAEIRKLRQKQFPRWVIIDDSTKSPNERKYWNGQGWAGTLRGAMLFADKDVVLDELITIRMGG